MTRREFSASCGSSVAALLGATRAMANAAEVRTLSVAVSGWKSCISRPKVIRTGWKPRRKAFGSQNKSPTGRTCSIGKPADLWPSTRHSHRTPAASQQVAALSSWEPTAPAHRRPRRPHDVAQGGRIVKLDAKTGQHVSNYQTPSGGGCMDCCGPRMHCGSPNSGP